MGCLDTILEPFTGKQKAKREAERDFFRTSPAATPGEPSEQEEEEKKKQRGLAQRPRDLGLLRLAQGGRLGDVGNPILNQGIFG